MLAGRRWRDAERARRTTRDDDDDEQDDDADDQAHSHLHVLPPHLLSDSVGAASEALRRDGQIVCLVLQAVEALATLGNFVDVVAHDVDGRVDFLHNLSAMADPNRSRSAITYSLKSSGTLVAISAGATGLARGNVGVVRLLRHCGDVIGVVTVKSGGGERLQGDVKAQESDNGLSESDVVGGRSSGGDGVSSGRRSVVKLDKPPSPWLGAVRSSKPDGYGYQYVWTQI